MKNPHARTNAGRAQKLLVPLGLCTLLLLAACAATSPAPGPGDEAAPVAESPDAAAESTDDRPEPPEPGPSPEKPAPAPGRPEPAPGQPEPPADPAEPPAETVDPGPVPRWAEPAAYEGILVWNSHRGLETLVAAGVERASAAAMLEGTSGPQAWSAAGFSPSRRTARWDFLGGDAGKAAARLVLAGGEGEGSLEVSLALAPGADEGGFRGAEEPSGKTLPGVLECAFADGPASLRAVVRGGAGQVMAVLLLEKR